MAVNGLDVDKFRTWQHLEAADQLARAIDEIAYNRSLPVPRALLEARGNYGDFFRYAWTWARGEEWKRRFNAADPALMQVALENADQMARTADELVQSRELQTRTLITDVRERYSSPFVYYTAGIVTPTAAIDSLSI